MKNTNVKKAVLPQILILAAAVIFTLAAWGLGKLQTPESLVSYSYEDRKLPEDMLSIIHEAGLVPVNARLEGSYFCPEADDAQLIVSVEPEQTGHIIEAKDRRTAGPTAPARGLCLMKVDY